MSPLEKNDTIYLIKSTSIKLPPAPTPSHEASWLNLASESSSLSSKRQMSVVPPPISITRLLLPAHNCSFPEPACIRSDTTGPSGSDRILIWFPKTSIAILVIIFLLSEDHIEGMVIAHCTSSALTVLFFSEDSSARHSIFIIRKNNFTTRSIGYCMPLNTHGIFS